MLIRALWGAKLDVRGTSVLSLRALPSDVDLRHVTNDRFLAFMDLGRVDLITRCGLLKTIFLGGYTPVVRFTSVRYAHPIRLFQRFELQTRVLGWDANWVWFEQVFVRNERRVAVAYCKCCMRDAHGMVATDVYLTAGTLGLMTAPTGELVQQLDGAEAAHRANNRQALPQALS